MSKWESVREVAVQVWKSQVTTAVLAAGLFVCAFGWWFELRPLAPEWGPVGTWVGGIATSLGLLFAAMQVREVRKQRQLEAVLRSEAETERREAMARSVGIASSIVDKGGGEKTVEYTLMNGGDYPIDMIVVYINDWGGYLGGYEREDGTFAPREIVIGSMYPKQVITDTSDPHQVSRDMPFLFLTGMASVVFTDTWGQSWERRPGELLKRDAPARMC